MKKIVFVYIWEYIVKTDHMTEFIRFYEPEGAWIQLFRKAEGYLRTDLHKDRSNPRRFLTVDYWNTKKDRDNFRNQFSEEYIALDECSENYTKREEFLGEFDSYFNQI
jgi:heme-degrading monooxygenase HmoA